MPTSVPNPIDNFKRFAGGNNPAPVHPEPPFPPVPKQIRDKFPDLVESWDSWMKSIALWQKAVQTGQ